MRGFGNGRIKKSGGKGEVDNGWGVSDRGLARQAIKAKRSTSFAANASPFWAAPLRASRKCGSCGMLRGKARSPLLRLYHTCNAHDITSVCSLDALLPLTGQRCSLSLLCQLSLRVTVNTRQPWCGVARFGGSCRRVESVAPRICGLAPKRANIGWPQIKRAAKLDSGRIRSGNSPSPCRQSIIDVHRDLLELYDAVTLPRGVLCLRIVASSAASASSAARFQMTVSHPDCIQPQRVPADPRYWSDVRPPRVLVSIAQPSQFVAHKRPTSQQSAEASGFNNRGI